MKRLTLSVLAAAAAVLPTQASAQTVKLKISHFLPPVHQIHPALTAWAKELEQKSGGKIKAEVFPSGQMGPPRWWMPPRPCSSRWVNGTTRTFR